MTPSRVPAPDAGLNSTGPHSVGSRWAAYGRQCRAHAARTSTPTPRRCAMKRLIVILAAAGFASVAGAQQPTEVEQRSEEHTSELQSLMRISYAVFCLKKKKNTTKNIDKTK